MCLTLLTYSTSLSTSASKMQGTCNGKSSTSPLKRPLLTSIGDILSKSLLNGDVELFPLHVPCIFEADVDRDVE